MSTRVKIAIGAVVALLAIIIISVSAGGGGGSSAPNTTSKPPAATAPDKPAKPKVKPVVTFKVWGDAPPGVLGPVNVTYGSDTENLQGKSVPFTETLPFDSKAAFYDVTAQLQGKGDIHCSVTVNGHTKTGHASGGYNICQAELTEFDW